MIIMRELLIIKKNITFKRINDTLLLDCKSYMNNSSVKYGFTGIFYGVCSDNKKVYFKLLRWNVNKKLLLILTAILLSACGDKVQDQKTTKVASQSTKAKVKQSSKAENNDHIELSYDHLNSKKSFGFNENLEQPKCEILDKFNLISYKCEISKNVFGANNDAILLENNEQRVFAYSSLKDCNEALEIRNSNVP